MLRSKRQIHKPTFISRCWFELTELTNFFKFLSSLWLEVAWLRFITSTRPGVLNHTEKWKVSSVSHGVSVSTSPSHFPLTLSYGFVIALGYSTPVSLSVNYSCLITTSTGFISFLTFHLVISDAPICFLEPQFGILSCLTLPSLAWSVWWTL